MAVEFKPKTTGQRAEDEACAFLEAQGLKLLQKNYRTPFGELDLIMHDQDMVVFIEVRLRQNSQFGSATETVTRPKQAKLIKTALAYLQKKRWLNTVNCRFDIIGINAQQKMEWLKNAFTLNF